MHCQDIEKRKQVPTAVGDGRIFARPTELGRARGAFAYVIAQLLSADAAPVLDLISLEVTSVTV